MCFRTVFKAVLLASATVPTLSHAHEAPTKPVPAVVRKATTTNPEIVVTASRIDVLGTAATASQGTITAKEVALRPILRAGQLFESIPGLVVTVHSGEGKASQYLIRGFNLDHGTDFANFVDDMPVNRPTNAHGQGYSDISFLIPELVSGIDYTKGPYSAAIGDFGSVASSHARLTNDAPAQLSATVGSDGFQRIYAEDTVHLSPGSRLLGAVELVHFDGPWQPPENFKKINAALRYSTGTAKDGFSLTGLYYQSSGLLTTDQPRRAVESGLIGRFGSLDPTDASRSLRYSLSAHLDKPLADNARFALSLYGIHSTMTLWNNFTHYLEDPVNGDQEQQDEVRTTLGGAAALIVNASVGTVGNDIVVGFQARYDSNAIDRKHTLKRAVLGYCEESQVDGTQALPYNAIAGNCSNDHVQLLDLAPYGEDTTHWLPWLRTVLGVRADYYYAHDLSASQLLDSQSAPVNSAPGRDVSKHQTLLQPKANLALGPWSKTEVYVSYGKGFHSDDVRGVLGTVPIEGIPLAAGATPLLAPTTGVEIGVRSNLLPHLSVQVAAFQQDFKSELKYDQDQGQDQASAPSRRQGIEISAQYKPKRWIELNTDLSFAKARYRGDSASLASFGIDGTHIADAPKFVGSFGVLIDNLGPWFGGLQWRILGPSPLVDGPAEPEDEGYSEVNLNLGYKFAGGWKLQMGIFNLGNTHQDAAAYYYTTRLPGEPAAGVADYQTHPLEPRSARFTITKTL